MEKRIESLSDFLRASKLGQVPAELEASIGELRELVGGGERIILREVNQLSGQ